MRVSRAEGRHATPSSPDNGAFWEMKGPVLCFSGPNSDHIRVYKPRNPNNCKPPAAGGGEEGSSRKAWISDLGSQNCKRMYFRCPEPPVCRNWLQQPHHIGRPPLCMAQGLFNPSHLGHSCRRVEGAEATQPLTVDVMLSPLSTISFALNPILMPLSLTAWPSHTEAQKCWGGWPGPPATRSPMSWVPPLSG